MKEAKVPTVINNFVFKEFFNASGYVRVRPISNGNMNSIYVYESDSRSILVKFPRANVSLGEVRARPPTARCSLEAVALRIFGERNPGRFPRVLFHSEIDEFTVLEYISGTISWQDLSIRQQCAIAKSSVRPFLLSTLTELNADELNALDAHGETMRSMMAIIADVSFRQTGQAKLFPYATEGASIRISILEMIDRIRDDVFFQASQNFLLEVYLTNSFLLIHGDLHVNSLLVKDQNAFVIDTEFAALSHPAFDAGVFAAHWMLSHIAKRKPESVEQLVEFEKLMLDALIDINCADGLGVESGLEISIVRGFMLNEIFAKISGPVATPFFRSISVSPDFEALTLCVLKYVALQTNWNWSNFK